MKKNTILLMTGTLLNKGLQFFLIFFSSRWLSTKEYGRFDLLYTYISLLVPIISLSIHEALFRFSVDEHDINLQKSYITNSFLINVVDFCLVVFFSLFFINRIESKIYVCFMFYLFAELFSVYLQGYLRAVKKLDIYAFFMVLTTIFTLFFVTLFTYVCKGGLAGILAGYGTGTLLGDIVLCFWSRWFQMLKFGLYGIRKMKKLLQYSIVLVPNNILWWIMNASDRQIINVFLGDEANGIYAIAHKISALSSAIFTTFSISWQQEIVEKINGFENNVYINQIFEKLMTALLTVCSILLAGSFLLYYYIFEQRYFEAIQYSPVLISSVVFMVISQFLGGIQAALKKPQQSVTTMITGVVFNIIIHILLLRIIGLYAASISTLLANGIIAFLRGFLLRDTFSAQIRKKTAWAILGYMYFLVMAYLHIYMLLNAVNLFLAVIFSLYMNKDMLTDMIHKRL